MNDCMYFVDSENVGDIWVDLLMKTDCKIVVFYTNRSPHMEYSKVIQLLQAENHPKFIKCYEGNNGLDFQLVSYMGYKLHKKKTREIIIVSNDTGFDAAVRFWKDRGMNVKRASSTDIQNEIVKSKIIDEIVEDEKDVVEDVTDAENVAVLPFSIGEVVDTSSQKKETETKQIYGIEKNEIYTIINCIGRKNFSDIHNTLVSIYGKDKGAKIYQDFKKSNFLVPTVQWKKTTKQKKMIDLILHYKNDKNILVTDKQKNFMMTNLVKEQKKMKNILENKYKKQGTEINKIFQSFYSALSKIN